MTSGSAAAALAAFAATNVDDFILLVALFSSLATTPAATGRIWFGQFLGIAALTTASVGIARGLAGIPLGWVALLGFIPLGTGTFALLRRNTAPKGSPPAWGGSAVSIAIMTVANGADNITVYVPLLRSTDTSAALGIVGVFALMTGLWCIAAQWVGMHSALAAAVRRRGPRLVPFLFILVGLVILIRSALP